MSASAGSHRPARSWRAAAAYFVVVCHTGCAGLGGAPSGLVGPPADAGRVALRVEAPPLLAELVGVPRGKSDAASSGASEFFLQCVGGLSGGGGGDFAALAYLIWLAGCTVATPIAAGIAAHKAPGADDVALSTATISDTLALGNAADELSAAVRRAAEPIAPDRLFAPDAVGDSRLQLNLTRLKLVGNETPDTPVAVVLTFEASVIRSADGVMIKHADVSFASKAHALREWSADGGQLVKATLSHAIPRIAETVVDFAFLLYPFPYQGLPNLGTWYTGLQADYPPRAGSILDPFWARVDNLRPTFRWEAFPRALDLDADPQSMRRVTHVRYDLAIAAAEDGAVVYRRDGLPSNSHELESALAPRQSYLWSVRARFELDGRTFVTEWAERNGSKDHLWPAPNRGSYLFKTP